MLGEIIGRIAQAREIRRALKLSRADFEAWKLEKFRRLARHVREHSPYYRRIIEERTKQAIADFLTRSHDPTELFLGKYRVIHTSGSSGEVGYFVYSPNDWLRGTYFGPRDRPPPRKRKGKSRMSYYAANDGH